MTTPSDKLRFAVAASFTAEPLRPTLMFWARQLQTDFEVRFAPYNQILQTLIDPAGEFQTNLHGVNVVLVRVGDLGEFRSEDRSQLEANVDHLIEELRAAPARMKVPLIVCVCPPKHAVNQRLTASLIAALQGAPGLHAFSYEDVAKLYPVAVREDPEGDRLGKIPYTEAFYCALGTMIVRLTHALVRAPFKVIALDCDNTLWQGICGEDGPDGVVLTEGHRSLHEFMLRQRSSGMLLTMASKNNEDDVLETFRLHPEWPLKPSSFVTWRLNWESKAANLESIAEQLSLGLDSFIFVDDNPKECAEVEQATPEVLTVPLPIDAAVTPQFLRHVWAFDHPVVTEEDRNRSASYEGLAAFGNEVRSASNLSEFMNSLKLRLTVAPLDPSRIPRVAQLTQRTNQFNLTTIRRTEADIAALASEGYDCYTAEVSDRFGDYGLVGVLIAKAEDSKYRIDTMLLSCRVLGRGVEHRLLAIAGETASTRGLGHVEVPYARTGKNAPARQFLESIDFGQKQETDSGYVLSLPSGQVSELKWTPTVNGASAGPKRAPSPALRRKVDYARIAGELSSVDAILTAMRRDTRSPELTTEMSDTERQLAGIWSELLERPSIAASDNFFDLGGHSLLAVLLLLRVREAFGVELSIDDVYSGSMTLSDVASRIEAAQFGDVNPDDYAALLAEIENMSDEEARELLARESERQQR